jgi:hypothetical protein
VTGCIRKRLVNAHAPLTPPPKKSDMLPFYLLLFASLCLHHLQVNGRIIRQRLINAHHLSPTTQQAC